MAGQKKLKVLRDDNSPVMKELIAKLDKKIKAFTKEIKSEGEKCGIILDTVVIVRESEEE